MYRDHGACGCIKNRFYIFHKSFEMISERFVLWLIITCGILLMWVAKSSQLTSLSCPVSAKFHEEWRCICLPEYAHQEQLSAHRWSANTKVSRGQRVQVLFPNWTFENVRKCWVTCVNAVIQGRGRGGSIYLNIWKLGKFAGIGIVINVAGCLIRGRRRWSVTYTSPRGLHRSEFRIWNRRAFQERNPYKFPGRMKNFPYYCPGRGANTQPPAHPGFITSKESHTLLVRP